MQMAEWSQHALSPIEALMPQTGNGLLVGFSGPRNPLEMWLCCFCHPTAQRRKQVPIASFITSPSLPVCLHFNIFASLYQRLSNFRKRLFLGRINVFPMVFPLFKICVPTLTLPHYAIYSRGKQKPCSYLFILSVSQEIEWK